MPITMMKRRWSNNGGFAFRMLEESSTEVTSSSNALGLGNTLSPSPLDSPVYGDSELWYDAAFNGHGGNGVITTAHGCAALLPPQTTIIPLPPLGGINNMNVNGNGNSTNGTNFGHVNGNSGSSGGAGGGGGGTLAHTHQLANGHMGNSQNNNNNNNNLNMNNNNNNSTNMLHATLNQGLMNGLMSGVLGVNGLMQHNGLNNMQQHTPRSDSANSISSGMFQKLFKHNNSSGLERRGSKKVFLSFQKIVEVKYKLDKPSFKRLRRIVKKC